MLTGVAVAAKMRILGKPALLQKLAGISLIKLLEIKVLDAYCTASIRVWRLYKWTVLYDANRTLCMLYLCYSNVFVEAGHIVTEIERKAYEEDGSIKDR